MLRSQIAICTISDAEVNQGLNTERKYLAYLVMESFLTDYSVPPGIFAGSIAATYSL